MVHSKYLLTIQVSEFCVEALINNIDARDFKYDLLYLACGEVACANIGNGELIEWIESFEFFSFIGKEVFVKSQGFKSFLPLFIYMSFVILHHCIDAISRISRCTCRSSIETKEILIRYCFTYLRRSLTY